jgi:hypothetical protein
LWVISADKIKINILVQKITGKVEKNFKARGEGFL